MIYNEAMKTECIVNNITLVYDKNISEEFDSQRAKETLELVYAENDLTIGTTELANLRAVFSTSSPLVQIVANDNCLVIANNTINKSSTIDAEFIRLAINARKIISSGPNVVAYGFNFSFAFKKAQADAVAQAVRQKFFGEISAFLPPDTSLRYCLPTYSYEKDGKIYSLKYAKESIDQNDDGRVVVTANVHSDGAFNMEAPELRESYQAIYTSLLSAINISEA